MKKHLYILLFFVFGSAIAQTHTMNNNNPVNSCSGIFVDSGGAAGNYGNNQTFTKTFCPTTPGGIVRFVFTEFSLENNADFLYVYDGNSTAAPLLATYTGTDLPLVTQPTGANTSGCLTFVFISDVSTVSTGWSAQLSCVTSCQTIQSVLDSTIPAANANNIVRICQGESVTFNGSATFSNSGAGASYLWSFDDGTTATGQSVTKVFNTPGVYRVNLTTRDANDCVNSNFINQVVQVAPPPNLSIFSFSDETCMNLPLDLTANASSQSFNYECAPPVSGQTFLPDGDGVSYTTSVVVDCFQSNQVLTSVNQIAGICLNIEHSYLGDLEIAIIAPNGAVAILKAFPGGGGTFLGDALDDGSIAPGIGFDYCFSTAGTSLLVDGPTVPVSGGNAKAPGTYLPAGGFNSLLGTPLNGVWTIRVTDEMEIDNGYIFNWSINFDPALSASNLSFTPVITDVIWTIDPTIIAVNGNTITINSDVAGEYCYTVTAINDFGCARTVTKCIDVIAAPEINEDPEPMERCVAPVDLSEHNLEILDGLDPFMHDVYYFLSEQDAIDNIYSISQFFTPTSSPTTIYIRVENFFLTCPAFTEFELIVDPTVCNPPCELDLLSALETTDQDICLGDSITDIVYEFGGEATGFDIIGLPNGVSFVESGGVVTISGIPTETGTFTYTISTLGCTTDVSLTGVLNIQGSPSLTSITTNSPICEGEDAVFTLTGSNGATVTYTIDGGAAQTVVLDATTGIATIAVPGVVPSVTINISEISFGNCQDTLSDSATVLVNPKPEITSLTGVTPICEGEDAVFTLEGTPDATVSYTLNAGATQTVVLDASGMATITVTGATANQTIAVAEVSKDGCTTAVGLSTTVVVNPNPQVTALTSNTTICEGEDAIFTIEGTPNATVTYSINGGAAQTIVLNASGIGQVSIVGVTANQNMVLSNITNGTTSCATVLNTAASVTVLPLPTANLSSVNPATCSGGSVVLNFTGTPNAVVSFTDGTTNYNVTLDGAGVNNYSTPPIFNTTTFTLTSVATTGAPSCTQVVGDSVTVTITPRPVMTVSPNPLVLCNGSTMNLVLASNLPGTTYTWSASTTNIVGSFLLSGDQSNINQLVELQDAMSVGFISIDIVPRANGCDGETVRVDVVVNPIPEIDDVNVSATVVCSDNVVSVSVSGSPSGISYSWQAININGVSILGGATSGVTTGDFEVTLTTADPLVAGSIQFEITPSRNGCIGASVVTPVVTVNPIPGTPIGLPERDICSGDNADLNISVSPLMAGTELDWEVVEAVNVTPGFATQGSGIAPIAINDILINETGQMGFVRYRVTTRLNDCIGSTTEFIVNVYPAPQPKLQDGAICVDASGVAFQSYVLDSGINGTMYDFDWYLNGNLIAGATGNTYTATEPGTYSLIVINTLTTCISEEVFATVSEVQPATAITHTVTDAFSDNATITVEVTGGTGVLMYQLDDEGFQESNVFTGVSSGAHTITVVDTQGCTYLTIDVFVIDYPPFFTPNGDGYNDTWNIFSLSDQTNAKIYIFDRYGKLIKQISPSGSGWDGRFNGTELPSTDYWFTVEYQENEQQKTFKAHFSLIR